MKDAKKWAEYWRALVTFRPVRPSETRTVRGLFHFNDC